jgi:hypothetical protein
MLYPSNRFLILISGREWVNTRAIVWLEASHKLKISIDIFGNKIYDLSACNIVPLPFTLPRAPMYLTWGLLT